MCACEGGGERGGKGKPKLPEHLISASELIKAKPSTSGKFPSNKEPRGSFVGRKKGTAGALINPD